MNTKQNVLSVVAGVVLGFVITPIIFGRWGLLLYFLLFLISIAFIFAAWQLAKAGIFFTFVGTGTIKTIDQGRDNLVRILENIDGYGVGDDGRITDDKNVGKSKNWLERNYGLFWIGFPPSEVHKFSFVHERTNPNIDENTPPSKWVQRDQAPKETDELLWEIPHSYVILGVELCDGFSVDVMFNTRSRVVDPRTALYLRQGRFIDYQAEYVQAGVISALKDNLDNLPLDSERFRVTDMHEGSALCAKIVERINSSVQGNQALVEAVGMTVVGGFISRWEPSDKTEKEALRKKKKAILDGEAEVETARLDAKKAEEEARRIDTIARAQAAADEARSHGQIAGLKSALAAIKEMYPGIDDKTALEQATALAISIKMSDKDSPVTVLGAGVNIGVTPKTKEK